MLYRIIASALALLSTLSSHAQNIEELPKLQGTYVGPCYYAGHVPTIKDALSTRTFYSFSDSIFKLKLVAYLDQKCLQEVDDERYSLYLLGTFEIGASLPNGHFPQMNSYELNLALNDGGPKMRNCFFLDHFVDGEVLLLGAIKDEQCISDPQIYAKKNP
jgi:hypothetical protein